MSEVDWAGAGESRQKIMSHVGRIHETDDGQLAESACDFCEEHGLEDCSVYTPATRASFFSSNEGYGCGRCRKLGQACSLQQQHQHAPKRRKTVASLEAIIDQQDMVIARLKRRLASARAQLQQQQHQQEEESEFEGFGDYE